MVGGAPCITKAYNFRKNSFLLLKNDTVSPCPTPFPATMRATWRSQTLPADTATVFNLHELVSSAGLAQIANPYPPASFLPPQLTGYSPACLATTATSGINFYALFEADNCTNISMRDP